MNEEVFDDPLSDHNIDLNDNIIIANSDDNVNKHKHTVDVKDKVKKKSQ